MNKYKVVKTYVYTEIVEILAETKKQAEDSALGVEGTVMADDILYDIQATCIEE